MVKEIWKPVEIFEQYASSYMVSTLGQVKSLDRTIYDWHGNPTRVKGRVLRPSASNAFIAVELRPGLNGSTGCQIYVSHIVAHAFLLPIGMDLKSFTIRFINGNMHNCAVDNLYLDPKDRCIFSKVDLLNFYIDALSKDWE
jgi:hypothetical protein